MTQKKQGDTIPSTALTVMEAGAPSQLSLHDASQGKTIAVVVTPGGFTPTCSNDHLPPYIEKVAQLKEKGVDALYCLSTNDIFVLTAWHKHLGAPSQLTMVSDGNGHFTQEMGMTLDLSSFGMGMRSKRYVMVVRDGTIEHLLAEEGAGLEHATAENLLTHL